MDSVLRQWWADDAGRGQVVSHNKKRERDLPAEKDPRERVHPTWVQVVSWTCQPPGKNPMWG